MSSLFLFSPPWMRRTRHHLARVLAHGALWACAGVASAQSGAAVAANEPAQPQSAGYYIQQAGNVRITALFDGMVALPRAQLKGVAPAQVDALLREGYVPEGADGVQTAVNAYLVQMAGRRVLVDAGAASCFGPGLGQVVPNLKAAGVQPEQVDEVLLTHAHPDHLCGVLGKDGRMVFPNATVWLDDAELAYWEGPDADARTPAPLRFIVGQTRQALEPYRQAGRVRTFKPGDTPLPGIRALPSPGHTPGHTSYLIDAGAQQKVLVWGDVVHYHAVQFARPSASYEVDVDRKQAIASRRDLLKQAAREGWWVAGAHLPFPGLGHARVQGSGYAWVPAEYSPLPAKKD